MFKITGVSQVLVHVEPASYYLTLVTALYLEENICILKYVATLYIIPT